MTDTTMKKRMAIAFFIAFIILIASTACGGELLPPADIQEATDPIPIEEGIIEESSAQIMDLKPEAESIPAKLEKDEPDKAAETGSNDNQGAVSGNETSVSDPGGSTAVNRETINDMAVPSSSSPAVPSIQSQTSTNGTGAFTGFNVTVLDKATLAVTSGGYDWPITKYYFVTANGTQLGYISGSDCVKIQEKLGVTPPGGGPYEPPGGGDWEKWFANEFNKFRGLAGTNSGASPNAGESAKTQVDTDAYASEIIRLVNEKRENVGLHALEIDSSLVEHAAIRAEELSIQFGHVRPNGVKESSECIARLQTSPTKAFNAWMQSDPHRTAILNENGKFDYNYVGAGCYQDEHGALYWVLTFCK